VEKNGFGLEMINFKPWSNLVIVPKFWDKVYSKIKIFIVLRLFRKTDREGYLRKTKNGLEKQVNVFLTKPICY
jgi:hypothetical protein